MSILGYDCNGRPLRAGDQVVLFRTINPLGSGEVGRVFTVTGRSAIFPGSVYCGETLSCGKLPGTYSLRPSNIRRLDDNTDHQPADAEFTTWLRGLGVGVPA